MDSYRDARNQADPHDPLIAITLPKCADPQIGRLPLDRHRQFRAVVLRRAISGAEAAHEEDAEETKPVFSFTPSHYALEAGVLLSLQFQSSSLCLFVYRFHNSKFS